MISLIPQHARRMKPPRVLSVPFILGRPLGVPDDPAFQHRVLDAALSLFERNDGPVFEEFLEDAPEASAEDAPWVCPVSFSKPVQDQSLAEAVIAEAMLLKPWYEKGLAAKGSTTFGVTGMDIEELSHFIYRFGGSDAPDDSSSVVGLKQAAEDLKAFYNEAAVNQPGTATAQDIEDWYWQSTEAGKLIKLVKENCRDSENRLLNLTANGLLVPHSQEA